MENEVPSIFNKDKKKKKCLFNVYFDYLESSHIINAV